LLLRRFCSLALPHLSLCMLSPVLFFITISGLFAVSSLSVCTAWFHSTVTSVFIMCVCACVRACFLCTNFVSFRCLVLSVLSYAQFIIIMFLANLCRVFTIIYLKQTMFLGYILLQLFCIYNSSIRATHYYSAREMCFVLLH
jgi:hypothetical protein